jgi:hypothetical protein
MREDVAMDSPLLKLVVGVAVIAAVGYLVVVWMRAGVSSVSQGRDAQYREAALANADFLLSEAFDGSPTVTYRSGPRDLPFDRVIEYGLSAGYALLSQGDEPGGVRVLVFQRARRG